MKEKSFEGVKDVGGGQVFIGSFRKALSDLVPTDLQYELCLAAASDLNHCLLGVQLYVYL